jgi:hypothetical protein
MKTLLWLTVLGLIGVGIYFGYKMAKGEGGWLGSCGGWSGGESDPWTTYTPPAEAEAAPEAGAEAGETA